jgi:hypothetical protein
MADIKKNSKGSNQQPSGKRRSEDAISKQLEKDADEMAEKAQEVEKKYDEDHDIFTK